MPTVIALAALGAVLIVLGVMAHSASSWVQARRRRAETLAAPHSSRRDAKRVPVHAVGDDHVR